jgi:hypothetical protein
MILIISLSGDSKNLETENKRDAKNNYTDKLDFKGLNEIEVRIAERMSGHTK